jgi:hypothetical protein
VYAAELPVDLGVVRAPADPTICKATTVTTTSTPSFDDVFTIELLPDANDLERSPFHGARIGTSDGPVTARKPR